MEIGICLMDVKLSDAIKEGRQQEHVKMSADFAKDFLKNYNITEDEYQKIMNCIEAHHGNIPFTCVEAEVCANADCYRFIDPTGVFTFMGVLAKRGGVLEEQIDQLKSKLEEKYEILSLDKAKEDLEKYYQTFLQLFYKIISDTNKN